MSGRVEDDGGGAPKSLKPRKDLHGTACDVNHVIFYFNSFKTTK